MERKFSCDCNVIHHSVVHQVEDKMLNDNMYERLALLYHIFGDGTRIRILHALEASEMCVCDLSVLLGMTKSAISHQLKTLRLANLVAFRREGQVVYYRLADDHVKDIIDIGLAHLQH